MSRATPAKRRRWLENSRLLASTCGCWSVKLSTARWWRTPSSTGGGKAAQSTPREKSPRMLPTRASGESGARKVWARWFILSLLLVRFLRQYSHSKPTRNIRFPATDADLHSEHLPERHDSYHQTPRRWSRSQSQEY